MEMINRAAYNDLRAAGMAEDQAQTVAAHLPDWSQFATKQDLARLEGDMQRGFSDLESRLIRWMVGIFVGSVTVVGGLLTVLITVVGS